MRAQLQTGQWVCGLCLLACSHEDNTCSSAGRHEVGSGADMLTRQTAHSLQVRKDSVLGHITGSGEVCKQAEMCVSASGRRDRPATAHGRAGAWISQTKEMQRSCSGRARCAWRAGGRAGGGQPGRCAEPAGALGVCAVQPQHVLLDVPCRFLRSTPTFHAADGSGLRVPRRLHPAGARRSPPRACCAFSRPASLPTLPWSG